MERPGNEAERPGNDAVHVQFAKEWLVCTASSWPSHGTKSWVLYFWVLSLLENLCVMFVISQHTMSLLQSQIAALDKTQPRRDSQTETKRRESRTETKRKDSQTEMKRKVSSWFFTQPNQLLIYCFLHHYYIIILFSTLHHHYTIMPPLHNRPHRLLTQSENLLCTRSLKCPKSKQNHHMRLPVR